MTLTIMTLTISLVIMRVKLCTFSTFNIFQNASIPLKKSLRAWTNREETNFKVLFPSKSKVICIKYSLKCIKYSLKCIKYSLKLIHIQLGKVAPKIMYYIFIFF